MPLSPSTRVTLIKQIAARLSGDDYVLLDLTLRQFGLPTTETWNSSTTAYVVEMVQNAGDSILVDLADHLGFHLPASTAKALPARPQQSSLRVFISHLARERQYAGELKRHLSSFGIDAFVAHDDIVPNSEWQAKIESELRTCDSLVALLHTEFHLSNWTDQEIGFVMGRGLPVFAVRFGQDPYGFIGRFQAFNGLKKNPFNLAEELFNGYRKHEQTKANMVETVLRLFETSGSFAIAAKRTGYLEELETWEPFYSARVEAALKSNLQISESFGVRRRIEAILLKWDPIPF